MIIIGQKQCKIKVKSTPFLPALKGGVSWSFSDEENQLESLAWVIMPDHLHWLFQLQESQSLSQITQLLKGRSAYKINHYLQRQGSIWDRAFHDHGLRKDEDIKNIARYIVANPLRAKLVKTLNDYPMWDAAWL
ncbi:MAG: hypothetical protein RI893_1199 [Pseudomonadota bacterium]|jgi:REP element-mobilizing transposase RayT